MHAMAAVGPSGPLKGQTLPKSESEDMVSLIVRKWRDRGFKHRPGMLMVMIPALLVFSPHSRDQERRWSSTERPAMDSSFCPDCARPGGRRVVDDQ